jgi:hypothetical protein
MKLPTGWGCGAVEVQLYDDGCDSLTLKATSEGRTSYIELRTTERGVALGRGDLQRLGGVVDTLLDLFDALNSEAPDAGSDGHD